MRFLPLMLLPYLAVGCGGGVSSPASEEDDADRSGDDDATTIGDDATQATCTTVVARPGTVITTSGPLTGAKTNATWHWLGVRYAEPPTGDLRWKPPVRASCVADETAATTLGPMCPQISDSGSVVGSEDCLTLNVWAPDDATGLPVLFFIHGGGNVQGTASDPLYDGHELATRTHSVVVTIEYRLGALGFFAHDALDGESTHDVSGNYGVLDQILALQWVRDNIEGFGGSPNDVLVFGESAGAQNTLVHVVSPLSAGLFQRALVESGGLYQTTLAETKAEMGALIAEMNCETASDVVGCMRAASADSLTAVVTAVGPLDNEGLRYGPVIDGYVIPDNPFTLLQNGDFNHVPFAIGSNADETSIMVPAVSTEAQYEATVRASYGLAAGNALLELYPAASYSSPRKALIALTTDVIWTCPTRRIASFVAAAQDDAVYRYYFSWRVPGAAGLISGSTHGLELPFVFRSFDAFDDSDYEPAPADTALSEAMQRYWSRFAASGDPNGGSDLTWPVYAAAADPYIHFDTEIDAAGGLFTANCDAIDELASSAP